MGNRDLGETPLSSACSCESPRAVVGSGGSQRQLAWEKKDCGSERWWVHMDSSEEREQGRGVRGTWQLCCWPSLRPWRQTPKCSCSVTKSCLTSLPGSSVHGSSQARILECKNKNIFLKSKIDIFRLSFRVGLFSLSTSDIWG